MTDPAETIIDTPLHDEVAAEQASTTDTAPADETSEVADPAAPGHSGDPAELPRLGFHEGRWHSTRTVAGPLSDQQIQDAVHEALVQAQNNGYVADGQSPDVQAHTVTGEDGAPTEVIIAVAVRENRAAGADAPEQADTETTGE